MMTEQEYVYARDFKICIYLGIGGSAPWTGLRDYLCLHSIISPNPPAEMANFEIKGDFVKTRVACIRLELASFRLSTKTQPDRFAQVGFASPYAQKKRHRNAGHQTRILDLLFHNADIKYTCRIISDVSAGYQIYQPDIYFRGKGY